MSTRPVRLSGSVFFISSPQSQQQQHGMEQLQQPTGRIEAVPAHQVFERQGPAAAGSQNLNVELREPEYEFSAHAVHHLQGRNANAMLKGIPVREAAPRYGGLRQKPPPYRENVRPQSPDCCRIASIRAIRRE